MFISCLLQLRHNCRDENFALKRIVRLKTPSTYKPDELFPSVQHVSNLLYNSIGRAVNFEDLTNLVIKRLQTLRTERFSTQVEAFADEFRIKANPETDYANFFDHAFRQGWNTCKVGSWQDGKIKSKLHKTLLDYREGKSAQKPRGAPFNSNLEYKSSVSNNEGWQYDFLHREDTQTWDGITCVTYPDMGRGVMTLKPFKKGDVICDYHGCLVDEKDAASYAARTGRDMSYIIEVSTDIRRLVDASNEDCPHHPRNLCLGRLCNHSRLRNKQCTARLGEVVCRKLPQKPRKVALVALRDLPPFTQVLFDYGDPAAWKMFN